MAPCFPGMCHPLGICREYLMCVPQGLMWTFHLPLKFESPQDFGSGNCPQMTWNEDLQGGVSIRF